jgi:hypothetical protein|tara:strand:+ start:1034 stop:1612 length:579 start_codon:yes stop_codon:yes gene_type:complete
MWELFQKVLRNGITPNQCFLLFSIHNNTTPSTYIEEDYNVLVEQGYIKDKELTQDALKIIAQLDNYFIVNKKKTTKQLLGKSGTDNIKQYREIFPPGKLPSGVPSRNNVKILTENFRWFFSEYDYTWEEIIKATKMYVNEYRDNQYMYMQNSQYFVSKQDKHRVKRSQLADYCDMIRDGVTVEEKHFKEKVV